jgi:hypothetical protein
MFTRMYTRADDDGFGKQGDRMTPEGRIKAEVLRYLERHGIFCWNNPTGAVRTARGGWLSFGRKGSADVIGILPGGRFLAVETKAPKGRLSPEQREFLDGVSALGGMAFVARSAADADAVLRAGGYIQDCPLFARRGAAAGA